MFITASYANQIPSKVFEIVPHTVTVFGARALMRLAGEPDRSFTTDEAARELDRTTVAECA